MKIVGYTRKSTDSQVASQSVQEKEIREWCESQNHELLRVYHEETVSGGKAVERRTVLPLLEEELGSKSRDFDAVVVYRLDRLFRNPEEQFRWNRLTQKHSFQLFSVTEHVNLESASGRFQVGIVSIFNAYEREVTGERVYAHNRARAAAGLWPCGYPPIGYKLVNGKVEIGDRVEDVIKIFQTFVDCGGNATATALRLNEIGIRNKKGGLWVSYRVLQLLRAPAYRGYVQYDGLKVEADIPKIIPAELLSRVDAMLPALSDMPKKSRGGVRPYSGILKCSECGGLMTVQGAAQYREVAYGKSTILHRMWACKYRRNLKLCEGRMVSDKYIDKLVGQALEKLLYKYVDIIGEEALPETEKVNVKSNIKERLQSQRKRWIDAFGAGVIDLVELKDKVKVIDKELERVKEEPLKVDTISYEDALMFAEIIGDKWPDIPIEKKREILLSLSVTATVNTGDRPLWIEVTSILNQVPFRVSFKYTHR